MVVERREESGERREEKKICGLRGVERRRKSTKLQQNYKTDLEE